MIYYRSRDGLADYGFSIRRLISGEYRIYIDRQPPYRGRSEGLHPTHRLTEGRRHYVCWDSPIRSLTDAKRIAGLWADKTQDYIRTGERFG